tara:strand:- start:198 stop:728 length:531 start_codon:yes stop_codon:yes gene_type:complete
MIITCNCGEKKFTLPDNSIPTTGRMVQCGFCGLKWKQFPVGEVEKTQSIARPKKVVPRSQPVQQKIQKSKKVKKTAPKKTREISLYSPEYLAKKHGIKIGDVKPEKISNQNKKDKVSFGFYNSLILFIFLILSISRILYFAQDFIVTIFPISEFYLNYFFESIRNIFEIWKNLISY